MMINALKKSVTLNDVRKAAERIRPFIHRTPILTCKYLNELSGKNLYFKCENFQRTGAFKIRGATNAVLEVLENNKGEKPIIVTHSSGNHAQAVALAAQINGLAAHIVMPSNSPDVKKNAVRGYGANIVESGPSQHQRELATKKLIDELGSNAMLISSSDHPSVIAGQGTMGLEILEDVPDLDAFVIPVSGGGMLSGISIAVKGINPDSKIFAAEPLDANDCAKSLAAGHKIQNEFPPKTIADGLRMNIGYLAWPIIRDNVSDVQVVTDEEIVAAMKIVFEGMKIVIEPSAAVSLAAVLTDRFRKFDKLKNVCAIFSGGNVDVDRLPWIK